MTGAMRDEDNTDTDRHTAYSEAAVWWAVLPLMGQHQLYKQLRTHGLLSGTALGWDQLGPVRGP